MRKPLFLPESDFHLNLMGKKLSCHLLKVYQFKQIGKIQMESIIEVKVITKSLLEYYCESEAVGIQIRGFIPPQKALDIADRLLKGKTLSVTRIKQGVRGNISSFLDYKQTRNAPCILDLNIKMLPSLLRMLQNVNSLHKQRLKL